MDSEGVRTDPQLQQFIETESQKQRFQQLVHQMTEVCWIDLHESVSAILTFLKNKARSKRIPQLPYDVQMCTEQPTNHCSSIQIRKVHR
ncbi:mitochondrial import inner membrane translocase subunit Tim8 A isoform X3 [Tachysurus fulvidraco]|uniref:mitochondrial import inner membrane translocase subunit Tim8 A isoform X3 n=1 Tax=Tachysurus fulvidraco TaxID=1234273 RepID=UPI000F5158AD|nr:mitochondrial import inner membrane translocase subunit Tim8 A isoform X3 [Tachysurus fulvidraco]